MPYWIELPPYDHVEILVQSAIQVPIIQLKPCPRFAQFRDADFDAFENGILDVSHTVRHGHVKLDDFCFLSTLQ